MDGRISPAVGPAREVGLLSSWEAGFGSSKQSVMTTLYKPVGLPGLVAGVEECATKSLQDSVWC